MQGLKSTSSQSRRSHRTSSPLVWKLTETSGSETLSLSVAVPEQSRAGSPNKWRAGGTGPFILFLRDVRTPCQFTRCNTRSFSVSNRARSLEPLEGGWSRTKLSKTPSTARPPLTPGTRTSISSALRPRHLPPRTGQKGLHVATRCRRSLTGPQRSARSPASPRARDGDHLSIDRRICRTARGRPFRRSHTRRALTIGLGVGACGGDAPAPCGRGRPSPCPCVPPSPVYPTMKGTSNGCPRDRPRRRQGFADLRAWASLRVGVKRALHNASTLAEASAKQIPV